MIKLMFVSIETGPSLAQGDKRKSISIVCNTLCLGRGNLMFYAQIRVLKV